MAQILQNIMPVGKKSGSSEGVVMQISSQSNPLNIYQQNTDKTAQIQSDNQISAAQTGQNKASAAPNKPQSDSVNFSADAKLLAEANRAASTEDSSRAEMVARLRSEVQSGTYKPNDRSIAEGILREDSALFAM